MTISTDDLVRREVHYCASQLISELCKLTDHDNNGMLHDQVIEISAPIPDPEEAAIQNGWYRDNKSGMWVIDSTVCGWGSKRYLETAELVCESENIDPYDYAREVFEHWIVSGWLADKLAEKGEAVDKDICGLTIWGRTTTGQAISMDAVIEEICADLNKARGGVPLYDPEGKLHTAKGLPGTC